MRNIFKIFLFLFISFGIATGINNCIPQYNAPAVQTVIQSGTEFNINKNINNHTISALNDIDSGEFLSQNHKKLTIGSTLSSGTNLYKRFFENNYLNITNYKHISFHNISCCLENEISTRAP